MFGFFVGLRIHTKNQKEEKLVNLKVDKNKKYPSNIYIIDLDERFDKPSLYKKKKRMVEKV